MAVESITLAQMAMGATAAGGAVGAYGSLYEGAAKKAAADYNTNIASRNASIALAQASADAGDKARENRRYLGALRASFGASGLDFSHDALDMFEDASATAETNIARIRYSGTLRAMGYQSEAALQKMQGKTAVTASYIGAASQVIGGIANMYRLKPAGGPSPYAAE